MPAQRQGFEFDPIFVQYARNTASLDSTINKLWLFLGVGVLGGTVLAALAGIAIAGRAMRPIADLTATAQRDRRHARPVATHA